jgi:O-antigen/teichoic acid export membrane protein
MASPLRSLLWSGIETLGTLAIGFASVIVIARLIGPDAFGLAAIGFGLVLVLMVFVSSLVHDGLVRSPDYSELQLNSAFTFSLIAGLLGILVLGLLALPLARLLDEPNLAVVLLGFLPMLLFGSLTAPLIAECRRALDFRTIGRHQLFCRTTGLALGIAVALAGGGVWSVVAQQLLTTGLLLLTLAVKRRSLPRLRLDWQALGSILRFSRYIAASGLVVHGTERLFLLLVGYLYGVGAAGQWAVASRLVETITTVLTQLLYHVGLAHLAALREVPAQLARVASFNRDVLILLVLPGLVALAAAAEPLIALLFGPGWDEVAGIAVWMLLGALFIMRRLFAQVALNVLGRSETMLFATAAESAVALAALAFLAPLGVIGAAVARGCSFIVGWLVVFDGARRVLDVSLRRETLALGLDLAVAIACIAAVHWLLADAVFAHAGVESLVRAALAGGLTLVLLAASRHTLIRELPHILAAHLQRR